MNNLVILHRLFVSKRRDLDNPSQGFAQRTRSVGILAVHPQRGVLAADPQCGEIPVLIPNQKHTMSYTNFLYHIIFRTKYSKPTINEANERDFYAYANGYITNLNAKLYRIGGMPNHVHLLVSLPATMSVSFFVQQLKTSTSKWLKSNPNFPSFGGWSHEYAAFSYGRNDKDRIVNYIKNQKQHHKKKCFAEEYRDFLISNGVTIDERYFLTD